MEEWEIVIVLSILFLFSFIGLTLYVNKNMKGRTFSAGAGGAGNAGAGGAGNAGAGGAGNAGAGGAGNAAAGGAGATPGDSNLVTVDDDKMSLFSEENKKCASQQGVSKVSFGPIVLCQKVKETTEIKGIFTPRILPQSAVTGDDAIIAYFQAVYPQIKPGVQPQQFLNSLKEFFSQEMDVLYEFPNIDTSSFVCCKFASKEEQSSATLSHLENVTANEQTVGRKVFVNLSKKPNKAIVNRFVEVVSAPPKFNSQYEKNEATFQGAWFIRGRGSGVFLEQELPLIAYNSMHALGLLCGTVWEDISIHVSQKIRTNLKMTNGATAKAVFQRAAANQLFREGPCIVMSDWLSSNSLRAYLAQLAFGRGYKSIQLTNEWDGTENFVHFIIDVRAGRNQCFSALTAGNPFSKELVSKKIDWWNVLRCYEGVVTGVSRIKKEDVGFIDGVSVSSTSQSPEFQNLTSDPKPDDYVKSAKQSPFVLQCFETLGAFTFDFNMRRCSRMYKIWDGQAEPRTVEEYQGYFLFNEQEKLRETVPLLFQLPLDSLKEKLVSYLSTVYGYQSLTYWQSLDETTIQNFFINLEFYYFDLPGFPVGVDIRSKKSKNLKDGKLCANNYKRIAWHWAELGRFLKCRKQNGPVEIMQFIEVHREGFRVAYKRPHVKNYTGCYYTPIIGTGCFLDVGRCVYADNKQGFLRSLDTSSPIGWANEDHPLSLAMMLVGVDTLLLGRYNGAAELVHNRTLVTSASSLVQFGPDDPRWNQTCEDFSVNPTPYVAYKSVTQNCYIVGRRRNASEDSQCTVSRPDGGDQLSILQR